VALCRRHLEWLGGGVGEGSDTVSDREIEGLHKTAVSGGVGEVRGVESRTCV
jgi:hypothetical protein